MTAWLVGKLLGTEAKLEAWKGSNYDVCWESIESFMFLGLLRPEDNSHLMWLVVYSVLVDGLLR